MGSFDVISWLIVLNGTVLLILKGILVIVREVAVDEGVSLEAVGQWTDLLACCWGRLHLAQVNSLVNRLVSDTSIDLLVVLALLEGQRQVALEHARVLWWVVVAAALVGCSEDWLGGQEVLLVDQVVFELHEVLGLRAAAILLHHDVAIVALGGWDDLGQFLGEQLLLKDALGELLNAFIVAVIISLKK